MWWCFLFFFLCSESWMLKMMSVEPSDRCKPICCTSIKKAVKINVDNACLTPICIFTVTSNILQNQVLKKTERYSMQEPYSTSIINLDHLRFHLSEGGRRTSLHYWIRRHGQRSIQTWRVWANYVHTLASKQVCRYSQSILIYALFDEEDVKLATHNHGEKEKQSTPPSSLLS